MALNDNWMLLPGCQYAKHFDEQLLSEAKEHAIVFLAEQRIVHTPASLEAMLRMCHSQAITWNDSAIPGIKQQLLSGVDL